MKVAVITPVHQTPKAWLEQCLDSVARQTAPCMHFLVCDGDDLNEITVPSAVEVLRLPKAHRDFGNTPRAIGSVSAISQEYDAIAYLDSDNWYEPQHVELLSEAHKRTGGAICTSGRTLYDLDGQLLGPCPEVDGENFVDTNCLFLTRQAFNIVAAWYLMPRSQVEVGDRFVWNVIKGSKLKRTHIKRATVNYRTRHKGHYEHFGKESPPGAKAIRAPAPVFAQAKSAAPARQKVSLCMIVRNEEKELEGCLRSVADLVHEMIVVDTGSADRTKEVALGCGAKVFGFPWADSFAAARNESLRHATGTWILWLDADERLDDQNRRRLASLLGKLGTENCVYMMKQWSGPQEGGSGAVVVDHARLFRKLPGVGWVRRVHEQILPALRKAGAATVFTDIVLRHAGYHDSAQRAGKVARNFRLLLLEIAEQPDDPLTLFYLGSTHAERGEVEQAVLCLEKCRKIAPTGSTFLPKTYCMLAQLHRLAGRIDDGLRICRDGKARFPTDVELWFEEGLLCEIRNDVPEAKRCFGEILELPRGPCFVGIDPGLRQHAKRHLDLLLARRSESRGS